LHFWHGRFLSLWKVSLVLALRINLALDAAVSGFEIDSDLIRFGPAGDMFGIQGLGITAASQPPVRRIWTETHS
jgi:hypothetical protein